MQGPLLTILDQTDAVSFGNVEKPETLARHHGHQGLLCGFALISVMSASTAASSSLPRTFL